jgi:hypothetical protein
MSLPIRRKQFDVQGFLAFLAANGCEIGQPTNPYEVVRYKAYHAGSKRPHTQVVYAKETGLLTWTGATQGHYRAFLSGAVLAAKAPPQGFAPEPTVPVSKQAKVRAKLRARDGDDCWFCGEVMGSDCTIEHLVPRSKGGSDKLDNYALAHAKCNRDAANKPLVAKIAMRAELRRDAVGNDKTLVEIGA